MKPSVDRPYLIIPTLVVQETWGGHYISSYKEIKNDKINAQKIGQSYELYGKSLLSFADATTDPRFQEDLVECNVGSGALSRGVLALQELIQNDPARVLGDVAKKFSSMPLLIKFTQALGNSFQLHVRKTLEKDPRWKRKPESWYYFEDGIITYGIKKGADMAEYKSVCESIDREMHFISKKLKEKIISFESANSHMKEVIQKFNPWKYVNIHRVKKHTTVDLSPGAIHHSWEEDPVGCPLGNVLYEVQRDVSDYDSTIRSFDKGKIQPGGIIRELHIDDYFKHIDTDPSHNDFELAIQKRTVQNLVSTPFYSLDKLCVEKELMVDMGNSFVHLFVIEGEIEVETSSHAITVGRGHSCVVPHAVGAFSLSPSSGKASILKTYV
ncbi:hypothetical protein COY90_04665 [Candidatus Roizmanbacteria bacterium CG_4_10_14_0_8_um_filter_39_9]|uniref:Phosphohexomutase n=1 Tax=Candidatus Roizmanbacteria bacterium CG_4_10_14_0_8_um_filter_39_9 TaxID=1974829 RepID=A0A2M7QCS5_9BACT|nr:MAG: hypothetical protein COY90_04665 [Candidatus Roizmanbacteria bacterium CG_4_10_14_0_8_um_filter_39_9]